MNDEQIKAVTGGKELHELPTFVPQPPDPKPVSISPEFDLTDEEQIAHAVELVDARIWVAIENMEPGQADKFFEELRKCVDDVEEAYWGEFE